MIMTRLSSIPSCCMLCLIASSSAPSNAFSPTLVITTHHEHTSHTILNVATNPLPLFQDQANQTSLSLPYFDDATATLNYATTISSRATTIFNNDDFDDAECDVVIIKNDPQCIEAGGLVQYCSIEGEAPAPIPNTFIENVLSSYIGSRAVLAGVAIMYATNFPLGAIMNDNLPASAATSSRMVLATLVLSPFLMQLKPTLRMQVLLGGSFVSLGYISQSIALVDTSPALVSFLGSATVMWCPFLSWLVDKKPMSIKEAPQTWLAAFLCLSGVAALELLGSSGLEESLSRLGTGDALSLVQAVGFGTGIFMSEKMMKKEPDQALPITAGLVATTAFISMVWCMLDGWMSTPGWESMGLPGLILDPDMRTVALAVAWTGVLSTSTNFCIENCALGRVPSSEASVILATEPLWASLFAAILFHEEFGVSDYVGGVLMITACLVNTLKPSDFKRFFGVFTGSNEACDQR
ncbi:predicted protein [Thalassiosira pseudonana CCMP1335]|uniref:EamA domain-containing protein n=1 Tax=Thalassiosira pseudonana TaxID=35128 RepID=B8C9Z6_THAPS|nr:predicted protein [Thalassiosira pseudonana CCMP1335]EED89415.1 predicted protein [Thalassiosira pseudonana CCMP1335]